MSHDAQSHHFVPPLKYYVGTFVALLALTVVTVAVTHFDFGVFNIVIAMVIAVIKASLVCSFFMGLWWDKKGFNRIIFLGSLLFLIIFISFTLFDVKTRGDIEPVEEGVHHYRSPVKVVESGLHAVEAHH